MMHWSDDPFDADLELPKLQRVTSRVAGAPGLAKNSAGLWIDYEYAGRRA